MIMGSIDESKVFWSEVMLGLNRLDVSCSFSSIGFNRYLTQI